MNDLADQKTYSCGTIRSNRGMFPDDFIRAKLPKGDSLFLKWGDLLAVHWSDKKDVFVLSSFHGNGVQNVQRHSEEVSKPDMICQYNTYMGGVDTCDQYMSYYSLKRKSLKWWKKVFFRLVEMAIVNAMCVYFMKNPELAKKRSAHKKFRELLVHALVQPLLDRKSDDLVETRGRPDVSIQPVSRRNISDIVRLTGKHFATKKTPRRKCTVCGYKKILFLGNA